MTDGALIGLAMGNAIADSTFRQIIGMKLLNNEKKLDDGVGMALLMSNNPIIQPPILGSNYRKNY